MNQPNSYFFSTAKNVTGHNTTASCKIFFLEAISGIEDVTYKNKYTVLFGQSHDYLEKEKQLIKK